MRVQSLSWEHHLEEGMDRGAWRATGPYVGLKRVRQDRSTLVCVCTYTQTQTQTHTHTHTHTSVLLVLSLYQISPPSLSCRHFMVSSNS